MSCIKVNVLEQLIDKRCLRFILDAHAQTEIINIVNSEHGHAVSVF